MLNPTVFRPDPIFLKIPYKEVIMTTNHWIGVLEDPSFKWEGGDWNGNTPKAISPDFPPISDSNARRYAAWVKKWSIEEKQTDWGAWVAKATGAQLVLLVEDWYQGDELLSWVIGGLPDLKAFVRSLNQEKLYAFVTAEW